ncbi:MAG: DUF1501 domain-containing protein, partial [Candidatus Hydrogenedentes bacterium]|nr:DUF1501 domain-containing protein [Candidatus Hydrogenedentota bacterium]
MNPFDEITLRETRRHFLGRAAKGIGSVALASLLNPWLLAESTADAASRGIVSPLHFAPKAKRVIHLVMSGGPSHLETFDYKPRLGELNGQPMPESFTKGQPIAQLQGAQLKCLAPQHTFNTVGKSGQVISEIFPHISGIADDICIVRSMQTEQINHDPANTFMNSGTSISGRPSMGAWVLYGLGSETQNLPGFVVLTSAGGGQNQPIAARQWHSGFLPSMFQGVKLHSIGDPVNYVANPPGVSQGRQRDIVDAVEKLNAFRQDSVDDPEIATRISQYEMAFKMQTSVPDLVDFSDEPQHILDLYGTKGGDGTFASNVLLARRLAERGVRFVQVYHRGWDHHGGVKGGT